MQDFAYFKSLYPAACKQMQFCVEAVCDELEYEGSPIYDEFNRKLTKKSCFIIYGYNGRNSCKELFINIYDITF